MGIKKRHKCIQSGILLISLDQLVVLCMEQVNLNRHVNGCSCATFSLCLKRNHVHLGLAGYPVGKKAYCFLFFLRGDFFQRNLQKGFLLAFRHKKCSVENHLLHNIQVMFQRCTITPQSRTILVTSSSMVDMCSCGP